MKITALEEYGLRCMLALAKNWPDKSMTMPELSVMEGLSVPYVGKLMMILKQARLVNAVRGRKGGYKLSRPPAEIHLDTIFKALGEPIYTSKHCDRYSGDNEVCVHEGNCNVRHMWQSFNDFIGSILHNLTLADLLNGNYRLVTQIQSGDPTETGFRQRESIEFSSKHHKDSSEIRTFK